MKIIKGIIIAFSIYSRIPMPHFRWEEEDMKYNLCFLPLVGVVTGLLVCLGICVSGLLDLPSITKICITSAVPLLVTGGFHVDGFMDVKDALSSYKPKDEKLAILKDPHIGAFAVIGLALYGLLWVGALAVIFDKATGDTSIALILVFVLSRILTAISSVTLKKAKNTGMLADETGRTGRGELLIMSSELITVFIVLAVCDIFVAGIFAVVLTVFFLYYRFMVYRQFGGVTGDTAGYFVCVSELLMIVALAVCCVFRSMCVL